MKLLINASTLMKGGALQVAYGFILSAIRDEQLDVTIVASTMLANELRTEEAACVAEKMTVLDRSPASSLSARRALNMAVREADPELVFTVFGPAYVDFSCRHLMGLANPWISHPNSLAYRTLPWVSRIKAHLGRAYRTRWARRADAWVTETETARLALASRLRVDNPRISVVPNTCGSWFQEHRERVAVAPNRHERESLRLLVLSAYYAHKDLERVPETAAKLVRGPVGSDFVFVLTLAETSQRYRALRRRAQELGVERHVTTVGPVPVSEVPALYESCHVTFMPTLLETSSAVFPESMAMGLPIVTTDLPFNRDVAGDAALYYEPKNSSSAARAIEDLVTRPGLWDSLVEAGKRELAARPTQEEKYQLYKQAILSAAARENEGCLA